MKKNILLSLAAILFLLSSVISCTDHFPPDPLPNHQRIKKITQILPGQSSELVTDFSYESGTATLKELKSYELPEKPFTSPTSTSYLVNNNNYQQVKRDVPVLTPGEYYIYSFNPAGQPTQMNYYAKYGTFYMSFIYNGDKLASSVRTNKFSSVSWEQKISYMFSGNNLGSVDYETTFEKNVKTITKSTSTFTYDDKVNPFFNLPTIPAPNGPPNPEQGQYNYYTFTAGFESFTHLSKNNVLSEKSSLLFETIYTYEYNAEGLPTKRVTMRKNTPQEQPYITETIRFEYETY